MNQTFMSASVLPKRLESQLSRSRRSAANRLAGFALACGAFFLWTNRGIDIGIQTLSGVQLASAIAFGCALHQITAFRSLVPRETRSLAAPLLLVSLVMIIVIALSMIEAVQPVDSIRFLGRWVYGAMYLAAALIVCQGSSQALRRLILAFLLGGAATALVCASGYVIPAVGEIVFQDMFSKRAMGFLSHPNQLAMIYTGSVVLAFWPDLLRPAWRVVLICTLLLGLLLTGSKFNMGLTVVLVPLLLFWLPAREGRIAQASANMVFGLPMVGLAVLAGAFLLYANNQHYYERLVTFVQDPGDAETTQSRFDLWNMAYHCWLEKPFFGIGAGNANQCLPFAHAHNVFVNYLLETGVFGLATLCAFYWIIVGVIAKVSARSRRLPGTYLGKNQSYRSIALLMIAVYGFILSNCASDSMGPAVMPTLWFYLSLVLTLNTNVAMKLRTGSREE